MSVPPDVGARYGAVFRDALIELDLELLRALWKFMAPHLAQPQNDNETLFMAHLARTQATTIPLKHRQYSHRWLRERGHGSLLPQVLWPQKKGIYRG